MKESLHSNRFSEVFSKLLERSKVSSYRISHYSGIDEAYLSRLKSGEKDNPSLETLLKIAFGLIRHSDEVTLYDIEDLFNSTGRTLKIR